MTVNLSLLFYFKRKNKKIYYINSLISFYSKATYKLVKLIDSILIFEINIELNLKRTVTVSFLPVTEKKKPDDCHRPNFLLKIWFGKKDFKKIWREDCFQ